MIHRPMSDPGVFSHQAMERDSTGIITPSGTFHQPVPAGYMDFPKVGVMTFLFLICAVPLDFFLHLCVLQIENVRYCLLGSSASVSSIAEA